MTGWLAIAGLGPGDPNLVTPEVTAALAEATDVIGYVPYVARVAPREGLTLHPTDNRVELDRATASNVVGVGFGSTPDAFKFNGSVYLYWSETTQAVDNAAGDAVPSVQRGRSGPRAPAQWC